PGTSQARCTAQGPLRAADTQLGNTSHTGAPSRPAVPRTRGLQSMLSRTSRRTMVGLAVVGALLLGLLAAAPAVNAATAKTIYVCQNKKTDAVRIVSKHTKCRKGEIKRKLKKKKKKKGS